MPSDYPNGEATLAGQGVGGAQQVPGMNGGGAGGRPGVYGVAGAPHGPSSQAPFYGGGDPDTYHYAGAGMSVSVRWDLSELQEALIRAYGFLSNFPTAAVVNDQAAYGLKYSIQAHTPVGPARDLSGSKAANLGAYGSETNPRPYLTRWTRSENDQSVVTDDMKEMGRQYSKLINDYNNYGPKTEKLRGLEREAASLGYDVKKLSRDADAYDSFIRDVSKKKGMGGGKGGGGGRGGMAMASAPGDANGNLFESIDVRCLGDGPNAVMHAQSLSYYGWFVESGNRNTLKPRTRINKWFDTDVMIPFAQLGDYPYFKTMSGLQDSGFVRGRNDAGQMENQSQQMNTLMFSAEPNGENEGYHMVERGMEDFVTKLALQWDGLAGRGLDAVWQGGRPQHVALANVGRNMRAISAPTKTKIMGFGNTSVWRGAGGRFVSKGEAE